MTTVIKQDDLIESVAAAFQYISYYHPQDFLDHMADAYRREESAAAKDAIGQILENSRLCQLGKRPLCQDTGMAVVFVKVGKGLRGPWKMPLTKASVMLTPIKKMFCVSPW